MLPAALFCELYRAERIISDNWGADFISLHLFPPPMPVAAASDASTMHPEPPIRLIKPNPPRLSALTGDLQAIEASGRYSNYGPFNTRLEQALVGELFGGVGGCVTVGNATLGLMLAIRRIVEARRTSPQKQARAYALMPAFTFAATAQAALWCGLTPLLCDIDPVSWIACPEAERALVEHYGEEIAVIVPCTTFGRPIDFDHYERLAGTIGAGIVIDAAAAVGTQERDGLNFGAGRRPPSVFSMHATKPFATLEGGFIYASDLECIDELRAMANFGFDGGRSAIMPGLNAKLNEVTAAMGLFQIGAMPEIIQKREALAQTYRALLPELSFQECNAASQAHVFLPALLPRSVQGGRDAVIRRAAEAGLEFGTYYAPHLGAQPYFQRVCLLGALPVTDDVSDRILSLPLHEGMTIRDVRRVAALIKDCCR